ncbi:hypothetical protein HDU67_007084, partial [Dinochytrium kinnereticum]
MDLYLIESVIFLIMSFISKFALKASGGVYLFALLLIALSAGAAYNIQMERTEQRFYALSETAGDLLRAGG